VFAGVLRGNPSYLYDSDDVLLSDTDTKQSLDEVTALHLACRYNSEAVIQLLLIRGAAVNATDAKGRTPLHYATRRGHQIAIKVVGLAF
jgi:ankyrin repeat protein